LSGIATTYSSGAAATSWRCRDDIWFSILRDASHSIMIGLFGLRRTDATAPADPGVFAATLRPGYVADAGPGVGGAVGVAAHRQGFPAGRARARRTGAEVAVTGVIFNIAELVSDDPTVDSAAALVASLYDSGRLATLSKANGQYAVAIYDEAKHRLVLITDRLASTAIHVWRQDGEVSFATQLYTLLGDRRIARKPNADAVAQLFTMQRTIGETSPIAGVTALPAACIATFDERGEQRDFYWQLAWKPGGFDDREGGALLADALKRTVARQVIGRSSGLLLSGGLDSRLVLAAAPKGRLSAWTTASYADNPELALARQLADLFGAEHHPLIVEPAATLAVNDDTVIDSGGLYPASNPMSAFLPEVARSCDVLLTGHGLDYTLRGYYLPARFLSVGGSKTRLPTLRPIPKRPHGRDVFASLRQGPPRQTIERIVRADRAEQWWRGQEAVIDDVLRPWLESDEPYNAWDGFILHAVSKHYAFTGMMAARAVADLAIPAFDNEVFGVYLGMTPQMRVRGRLVHHAMRRLSPDAAQLPNANTHFRADLDPWLEVASLLGRAGLRRLGLAARTALPSGGHSEGSWQNLDSLYQDDPGHRQRFLAIRDRLDSMTGGVLSADGIAACINEHLEGRKPHAKLLRQLLTHDAWVRGFGIEASG
jgi:asparagine synthase (glutamine-hydrolysing)